MPLVKKEKLPGFYIFDIAHDLKVYNDKRLKEHSLTSSQMKVMRILWHCEGLSQSELLAGLKLKPSSLTRLLDQLEQKALVVRQNDDNDGRSKRIFLTDAGRNIKKVSWQHILEAEAKLISGFSEQEQLTLLEFLMRLAENSKLLNNKNKNN